MGVALTPAILALRCRIETAGRVTGAGFVRFLYGVPSALALFVAALLVTGPPVPAPNGAFLLNCTAGGRAQILATNLLIMAFGFRNFAAGTAYSKTETRQSAIAALIILGEVLRPLAWVGICVGLAGVITLSLTGCGMKARELAVATVQPAALAGLGAGFLFALTTVCIKLANCALSGPSVFVRALFVLVVTNTLCRAAFWPGANRSNYARHLGHGAVRVGLGHFLH